LLVVLLKINNPDHVIILNGNHEDKDTYEVYGLSDELQAQDLSMNSSFIKLLWRLPSACFLIKGDKKYHLSHGGIEYDFFLQKDYGKYTAAKEIYNNFISSESRASFIKLKEVSDSSDPSDPKYDNSRWGDYTMNVKWIEKSDRGAGYETSPEALNDVMQMLDIAGVIRGHQDNFDFAVTRLESHPDKGITIKYDNYISDDIANIHDKKFIDSEYLALTLSMAMGPKIIPNYLDQGWEPRLTYAVLEKHTE